MTAYRNMMEIFMEQLFDDRKDQIDCCTCPECRSDIIALALNQLPPRRSQRVTVALGPRSVDKRLARDAFGLLYLAPRPAVGHAELFCGLAQRSEFVDKLEKLHTPPAEAFPIFALQP